MSGLALRPSLPSLRDHVDALQGPLDALRHDLGRIEAWGEHLAGVLLRGGRLLAAGNGGSAAQAQHLTSEFVGRFRDERRPYSAIALHADTSALTAIGNDYAPEELFARQVRAHGRNGDVLVLLSTSGRSRNVLAAADAGHAGGLRVWGLTGAPPNPLAERCHDAVVVPAPATATVQEVHQIAVHLLCLAAERHLLAAEDQ